MQKFMLQNPAPKAMPEQPTAGRRPPDPPEPSQSWQESSHSPQSPIYPNQGEKGKGKWSEYQGTGKGSQSSSKAKDGPVEIKVDGNIKETGREPGVSYVSHL